MPKPAINFQILRHIAESASGLRYQDTWFVITQDPEHGPLITPQPTAPVVDDPDATVIFCERVDYARPPAVTQARIGSEGVVIDLLNVPVPAEPAQMDPAATYAADAVFWSLSAVEKFLSPYYASVYGDDGARMVAAILEVLKPATSEQLRKDQVEGVNPAFAIAHLPNSEYVGVEETEIISNMFALRRNGDVHRITPRPRAG